MSLDGLSSGVVGKASDEESWGLNDGSVALGIGLLSSGLAASEWLLALGLLDGEVSSHVLGSVELEGFGERRLLGELDEGSSLGLAIISGQESNLKNVSAFVEEVSDVAVVGLERESSAADLEGSFLISRLFLFNGLSLLGSRLGGYWLGCWLLSGGLLLFALIAGFLLGNDLSGLLGSGLFLRLLFG